MNNHQRLMKEGLLNRKRQELSDLEHRAESLVESIQVGTFIQSSALDLDAEKIVLLTRDLAKIIADAAEVRRQINRLEDELGL